MGVAIGNPIVISGPYSGKIIANQIKSLKVENVEFYAYTKDAYMTIKKKDNNGNLYADIKPIDISTTVTRDFDGLWFKDPYVSAMTSGVCKIYLR